MPLGEFHPAVRTWFEQTLGAPTPPQVDGWPRIRSGKNVLIAAPTGSGKTLAAFLYAIDELFRCGRRLPDETRVLYVSPLKALGNDVQKNLQRPLKAIRERDVTLPEVRVVVRTGDTPQNERAKMARKHPHILVTTPESLYILLTSAGGRDMLRHVRSVIVDEIHATLGDKRGSHLALSLERLQALAGDVQRIGLSATQKPLSAVANFLVGTDRECELVDSGFLRQMDVALEVPPSPLSAVCSHEVWDEIYDRMATLIQEHRTTLVFVNTRKMAERIAARLTDVLGEEKVDCHHSSLSKDRRLRAEQRLKDGELRALVATASLELGIDVGDVDLVIQVGTTRSIATFLQRVGRAGHRIDQISKGRLFPLTRDELLESIALMRALQGKRLDRTPIPGKPLDILAQHMVAACAAEDWDETQLFETVTRAWPYRDLSHEEFEQLLELHSDGRRALLHRDGVGKRVLGTRRSRLTAMINGGAIPDNANYRVILEPDGTYLGTLDEDFAVESSAGDVFQLGNASWMVLRVESGTMRVADAQGAPPSLPFWFGEAPSRTEELSEEISVVRENCRDAEWATREVGAPPSASSQVFEYLDETRRVLGTVPTQSRLVLERFFDESGGMQLVLHSPWGGRINRAFGYALRKRFCRGFGFELQAASTEEAILLSLGPQHSFPLEGVFDYVSPSSARKSLTQAILPTPVFKTRWRWNVTRSLMLDRRQGGKKVPPPLLRMRAEDLLVKCFPQVMACPETLPGGDLEVPEDHPIVRQTIEDCLTEAMDTDGFIALLEGLKDGSIERVAVDVAQPSPMCQGILTARPYSFLDDAPLEERRTQAVMSRRVLDPEALDTLGELDPEAIERVRDEAWPQPRNLEEVHEALLWMGYLESSEADGWMAWLEELRGAGRVELTDGRWYAAESSRDPLECLRGRMEALGPVPSDDPLMAQLEVEGCVLRVRVQGQEQWCNRRLLARIRRYTLNRLRREIQPVSASEFLRFLACWQHVDPEHQLEGPEGTREVLDQLAGCEAPAAAWESSILTARVRDYRKSWLDQITMSGEIAWGRLWGSGAAAIRSTPLCFFHREDLELWLGVVEPKDPEELSGAARDAYEALQQHGAMFPQEMLRRARLLPAQLETALGELVARGFLTGDSFGAVRQLITPRSKRRRRLVGIGRWSLLQPETEQEPALDFFARQLLKRTGVVFRKILTRERIPVSWRDLLLTYRRMELRGEVRGGRFVAGFDGEQFALPEAVSLLRKVRRLPARDPLTVAAADPLNFRGILTPEDRVSPQARKRVAVG